MSDLTLESIRAIVLGITLILLLRNYQNAQFRGIRGWWAFVAGFGLFFFGTLIDITDNFPSLNSTVVFGETKTESFLENVLGYLLGSIFLAYAVWRWMPLVAAHQSRVEAHLQAARADLRVLRGLLPICATCKKIRDDDGYWNQIESYISAHSEAEFTHGICPECSEKLYPKEHQHIHSVSP